MNEAREHVDLSNIVLPNPEFYSVISGEGVGGNINRFVRVSYKGLFFCKLKKPVVSRGVRVLEYQLELPTFGTRHE